MEVLIASCENSVSKVECDNDTIVKETFSLILNFVWH